MVWVSKKDRCFVSVCVLRKRYILIYSSSYSHILLQGFLAWYWTCWFGTAGLSYLAIEVGGVDPIMVAHKIESFLGWEYDAIAGRVDPQIGMVGLVVAVNECLEPLRLPFVVLTTKPVVNFFTKKY